MGVPCHAVTKSNLNVHGHRLHVHSTSRCHKFAGLPDPFDRVAKISSRGFTVLWGKLGVGPKCCEDDVWLLGINVATPCHAVTNLQGCQILLTGLPKFIPGGLQCCGGTSGWAQSVVKAMCAYLE